MASPSPSVGKNTPHWGCISNSTVYPYSCQPRGGIRQLVWRGTTDCLLLVQMDTARGWLLDHSSWRGDEHERLDAKSETRRTWLRGLSANRVRVGIWAQHGWVIDHVSWEAAHSWGCRRLVRRRLEEHKVLGLGCTLAVCRMPLGLNHNSGGLEPSQVSGLGLASRKLTNFRFAKERRQFHMATQMPLKGRA